MEHKEHIEAIIKRTFKIIKEVYDYQQEKFEGPKNSSDKLSRIIFPQKRQEDNDNKQTITRVSEQELKLIFIEQLNLEICKRNWDVYYSVETPTEKKYRFTGEKQPRQDDSGRSANFDLVIHDNKFKRIALIEFKANNPKSSDYLKDFVKLNEENYEGKVLRYFIEIVKNADSGTSSNLQEKVKGNEGIFWCYSLEKGEIINSPIK